jgi:hypothetical protein
MLSRAAQAEIQSVAPEFLQIGIDPVLAGLEGLHHAKTKAKANGKGNSARDSIVGFLESPS